MRSVNVARFHVEASIARAVIVSGTAPVEMF
jgi:hypothetical protein